MCVRACARRWTCHFGTDVLVCLLAYHVCVFPCMCVCVWACVCLPAPKPGTISRSIFRVVGRSDDGRVCVECSVSVRCSVPLEHGTACECVCACCTNFPDNLISAHPTVNPRRHTCSFACMRARTHARTPGGIIATTAQIILCAQARRGAPISLGARAAQQQMLLQSLRCHPDARALARYCCRMLCSKFVPPLKSRRVSGGGARRSRGVATRNPRHRPSPPPSSRNAQGAQHCGCVTMSMPTALLIAPRHGMAFRTTKREQASTQRYILWISS